MNRGAGPPIITVDGISSNASAGLGSPNNVGAGLGEPGTMDGGLYRLVSFAALGTHCALRRHRSGNTRAIPQRSLRVRRGTPFFSSRSGLQRVVNNTTIINNTVNIT